MSRAEVLVVDSGGFIKNAPLRELAGRLVTLQDVVSEIRDKETRQRMQVLPYDLEFRVPSSLGLAKVSEFAKKTGDFASLSLTDLNVLAVTWDLEVELRGGSDHLKAEPTIQRTTQYYHPKEAGIKQRTRDKNVAGFYQGEDADGNEEVDEEGDLQDDAVEDSFDSVSYWREPLPEIDLDLLDDLCQEEDDEAHEEEYQEDGDDFGYDSDKENVESDEGEGTGGEDGDDDDDDSWITPSNLKDKKKQFTGDFRGEQELKVAVACMTTDFAMQNVLKQIGLNILGTDGMVIRETKTWILRCYACFHTTPRMEKKFCPKCGNKTLKRVSVTVDSEGKQQVHISTRRQLTSKGKRFSLPAPKGGKHSVNPRLVEDQREAQQRLSKKALLATNPTQDEFVPGNSPFYIKDVTSKSAMLGLQGQGKGNAAVPGLYWDRKNPNAVKKNTGNRRKKKA